MTSPTDCDKLEGAICHSMVIGVSDGSYMPHCYPNLATAAWIIADSTASHCSLFSGICTVQGPNDLINAYWAELQGIHTLLVALEYFCSQ